MRGCAGISSNPIDVENDIGFNGAASRSWLVFPLQDVGQQQGIEPMNARRRQQLHMCRVPIFLNRDPKHGTSKIGLAPLENVVREFGFGPREDFDSAFSRLFSQRRGFRRDGRNVVRSYLDLEGLQRLLQEACGSRAFQPNASRVLSQKRRGLFMQVTFKQGNHARPTAD